MKRLINMTFLILLLSTSVLYAGQIVCHDESGKITFYGSGSPAQGCLYFGIINESDKEEHDRVLTLFKNSPKKYIKVVNSSPVEITQAEKDAVDAAELAENISNTRLNAKDNLEGFLSSPLFYRTLADTLKDEINILRQWLVSFKAEVAAATNLADLKTRVAALPNTPDRTLAQLKTAINNKIDSGNFDI